MKRFYFCDAGIRLKSLRRELKLSRDELAEILELSPRYIAQIESGERNMSAATLYLACSRLHVSADYLLMGIGQSQPLFVFMEMNKDYNALIEGLIKVFIAFNNSKEKDHPQ